MTNSVPDKDTISAAVALACRAPSVHNSQPWRWVAERGSLQLYSDPDRLLVSTDAFGRQMILSCGAALNHLQVALRSMGWQADIHRVPNPENPAHLAAIEFRPTDEISATDVDRANAIGIRRTDRLPFADPANWPTTEAALRRLTDEHAVGCHVLTDDGRPQLATASELTAALRRYDSLYQAELHWWTGHSNLSEGVPREALPSEFEHQRVPTGRKFPATNRPSRRPEVDQDHSRIIVLTTNGECRLEWLQCGEALSALLVEATVYGLATCSLTHITELPQSREIVRKLINGTGLPQVVIRVGITPEGEAAESTPRRPLADVLQMHE